MGWFDDAVSSVSDAASNVVDSAKDFVAAPAATITNTFTQQRNQAVPVALTTTGVLPAVQFASGNTNIGAVMDDATMRYTNANMSLITGRSENDSARAVRNTVATVAAVVSGAALMAPTEQASMLAAQEAGTGWVTIEGAAVAGGSAMTGITAGGIGQSVVGAGAAVKAGKELFQDSSPAQAPAASSTPAGESVLMKYLSLAVLGLGIAKLMM